MTNQDKLNRIEKVLDYIHDHLDETIHVAELAEKSCWSRWQFQRVFGEATGLTVAQYTRELRLSHAAELLLSSPQRHLDIAMQCGFDSEISFSRAFKQMFHTTPRDYRQRGVRQGLRTPLQYRQANHRVEAPKAFTQIRIENRSTFQLKAQSDWVYGPFSNQPDFQYKVRELWRKVDGELVKNNLEGQPIGVIDTQFCPHHPEQIHYWASYLEQTILPEDYPTLTVPAQEYAVIPVHGKVQAIEEAVRWFLFYWLPDSDYNGVSGFELEMYQSNYDPADPNSYMEYWLPIESRK